jgi:hypothetical protein
MTRQTKRMHPAEISYGLTHRDKATGVYLDNENDEFRPPA